MQEQCSLANVEAISATIAGCQWGGWFLHFMVISRNADQIPNARRC
jgi:hypothetical protein